MVIGACFAGLLHKVSPSEHRLACISVLLVRCQALTLWGACICVQVRDDLALDGACNDSGGEASADEAAAAAGITGGPLVDGTSGRLTRTALPEECKLQVCLGQCWMLHVRHCTHTKALKSAWHRFGRQHVHRGLCFIIHT